MVQKYEVRGKILLFQREGTLLSISTNYLPTGGWTALFTAQNLLCCIGSIMACRNLTKKFLDIRNAAKANRSLGGHDSNDSTNSNLLKVRKPRSTYYQLR